MNGSPTGEEIIRTRQSLQFFGSFAILITWASVTMICLLLLTSSVKWTHIHWTFPVADPAAGWGGGGREAWNLCGRNQQPSFYDLFLQGGGGEPWPPSAVPWQLFWFYFFSWWTIRSVIWFHFNGWWSRRREEVRMWYSWGDAVAKNGLSVWWQSTLSSNGGKLHLEPSVVYSGPVVYVWW